MLLLVQRRSLWQGDQKMGSMREKVFAIARGFWGVVLLVCDRISDDVLNKPFGAPLVAYIPSNLP